MNKRRRALITALGAGALLAGASAWAEITPPKIGTEGRFECTGPGDSYSTYKVVKVENGMMRIEGESDGKVTWTELPSWAGPTTIFSKKDRGDGRGERNQKIVNGNLEELAKLEPGSKLEGEVKEWHSTASWKYKYSLEVGEARQVSNDVVGNVEVVTIIEKRKCTSCGNLYESTMTRDFAPALGVSLGFEFKDAEGTRKCVLTSRTEP